MNFYDYFHGITFQRVRILDFFFHTFYFCYENKLYNFARKQPTYVDNYRHFVGGPSTYSICPRVRHYRSRSVFLILNRKPSIGASYNRHIRRAHFHGLKRRTLVIDSYVPINVNITLFHYWRLIVNVCIVVSMYVRVCTANIIFYAVSLTPSHSLVPVALTGSHRSGRFNNTLFIGDYT